MGIKEILKHKNVLNIILSFGMFLLAFIILAIRNRALFEIPNFYAEDATIFLDNTLDHPLSALFTLFNGYLVVGQYLLLYAAQLSNALLGNDIAELPLMIAFISTAFFALCITLPYVLFRKELGYPAAFLVVISSACVPMVNSSFAIIGTIGNLKFIFVYVAFLLILYRNIKKPRLSTITIIDILLLLIVLTNITAVFLLPFALWPYRRLLLKAISGRSIISIFKNPGLVSLMSLHILAAIYVTIVYTLGIPSLPGYLDGPYQSAATLPLLDRSTMYAWLYPVTDTLRAKVVIGIWCLTLIAWWHYAKRERFVLFFGLYTIATMTVLFVLNRTGVSAYFLDYKHNGGPDQFFYAQNLIFIFLTFWLLRGWLPNASMVTKGLFAGIVAVYLVWAIPFGTTLGQARAVYGPIGNAEKAINAACQKPGDIVKVQVYPTETWEWKADREDVC